MKALARPTQIALGILLALLLAVMPLQPMAVYADDAAGAPDASGTPAVQPEGEGPEGGLGENPVPSTGTDEAAKQNESAGEHKDTGEGTNEPALGAEGAGTATPHAPEANTLLTPPAAALGETEDTPEEGTDENISLLSQPDIAKATEIITNTPCVVSSEELGEVSDFTAGQWVNDVWMKTLTEPLRKQAGVDTSDLKFAIATDGWTEPIEGNNSNVIGEAGKLDFIISGEPKYPSLSIPKMVIVTPKPYHQEVTSSRAFTVTGGVEGKDYQYPETVASSEPYRKLRVLTSTPLTISMATPGATTNDDGILVPSGVSADITLNEVNISLGNRIAAAVAIEPGATATIHFAGENTLISGYNHAGIEVPTAASATIDMSSPTRDAAKVEVRGGAGAAGVGGPFSDKCGAMTFTRSPGSIPVILKAYGGERNLFFPYNKAIEPFGGAGVGGGACIAEDGTPTLKVSGFDESITIKGGTFFLYGATRGAGLGGGAYHTPAIFVTGGTFVEVIGGRYGAGIGGGAAASAYIEIEGDALFEKVQGGRHSAGIGSATKADTAVSDGNRCSIYIRGFADLKDVSGGASAAGIGGGLQDDFAVVMITGRAFIHKAKGGEDLQNTVKNGGAGIGSGALGQPVIIKYKDPNSRINTLESSSTGIELQSNTSKSSITIAEEANVTAIGAENAAGIGGGYGSEGGNIVIKDESQVNATGGTRAAGIGGGHQARVNKDYWNGDSGNIQILGGTHIIKGGGNSSVIGGGQFGRTNNITISNAELNVTSSGGWNNIGSFFGNGAIQPDLPVPENQSITLENCKINFDSSKLVNEKVKSFVGGPKFEGDIVIDGGTFTGNILSHMSAFYTGKENGIIVKGGAFNLTGDGQLFNRDPVNSKGQKVYANVLELQDTKEVVEIASGVLEGGTYNFSGIRTDTNGTTTLFLPATNDGARLRSAEPEAATTGNAGNAGAAMPAYLTGPQLARAKAPNAAISTLASTSGEAIVSMTTTAGIRYQNSFVRPAGQTNQETLYKNGVVVSFDLNGGSGNAPDQTLLPGDTVVSPNVWRSGFRLKEWTRNGQPYDLSHRTTVAEATAGGNFTLVAQWEVRSSTPDPDYAVTVNNGTGDGRYTKGETVTITADAPEEGKRFKEWTVVSGGAVLVDATSASTTFTMPAKAVEVTATYEDETVEPKPDPDPGPSPDPGPGPTPPPGPTDPSTGDGGDGSGTPKPLNPSGNNGAGGAGSGSDAWLVRTGDSPLPLVIAGVGGLALAAVAVAGGILFARRSNALVTRHVIRRH